MAASNVVCDSYRMRGISTVKVPPGVVQAQFTKITANGEEQASTFKVFKIPTGAVILDIIIQADSVASLTLAVGDSLSTTTFIPAITCTTNGGSGSLLCALSNATPAQPTLGGLGKYYGAEDYVRITTGGATWTANKTCYISMTYFIAERVQGKRTVMDYDSENS